MIEIGKKNIVDILEQTEFSKSDIIRLLAISEKKELELLQNKAIEITENYVGKRVFLRGLVEFSNYCVNDCYYCGIRKSNNSYKRYFLTKDEIIKTAKWIAENGYGSIVLQSGERRDDEFIEFVIDVIHAIKKETKSNKLPKGLGITLCVGEQSFDTFKAFFDAGAHRYLLRIETTNEELFTKIHPPDVSYSKRLECLNYLKSIGYQTGTGVMIALPNQTIEDLANDIIFFKDFDIDMLGMGPFIPHTNTPMGNYKVNLDESYILALKMIAVCRIVLKDVNIASTTALQAIKPFGREAGLNFGANVFMPLVTPTYVRSQYQLYDGKPCIDEAVEECYDCSINRISSIGRKIGLNEWGDSKHYFNRKE